MNVYRIAQVYQNTDTMPRVELIANFLHANNIF